jgi:hypothetical protein
VAEAEKKGIEEAGGIAHIYQVAETFSDEVLAKLRAPPKPDYPVITPEELVQVHSCMLETKICITLTYDTLHSMTGFCLVSPLDMLDGRLS